ncbi:hypothetical protein AAG906_003659 [Vitis piasezkii]
MESGGAGRRSLSINNRSFRLRCPSLNSVRLRRIFDLFDKNSDGTITVTELSQALALLGLDADLPDLQSIVQSHIKPGNLGLEFDDFAASTSPERHLLFDQSELSQEESDLNEAFKVFDEDGDGYISAQELQVVLGKLGLAEGKEIGRVKQMITSVDRNQDGRVDFFEFKDMMRSVVVRSS